MDNKEILEAVGNMTIMEVVELTEAMEEKFGVSANSILQSAVPAEPVEEEATEFNLTLTGFEENKKVPVIKVIREILRAGLLDSKKIVEGAPSLILEGVSREEADNAKGGLEAAGGIVEVKGV